MKLYPGTVDGTFGAAVHTVAVPVLFDALPGRLDGDAFVDLVAVTNYHDDDTGPSLALPISFVFTGGGYGLGVVVYLSGGW